MRLLILLLITFSLCIPAFAQNANTVQGIQPGGLPGYINAPVGVNSSVTASSVSLTAASPYLVPINATSNAVTVNLEAAASNSGKSHLFIVTAGANNATITANGSDTIGAAGISSVVLSIGQRLLIISDGTSTWRVLLGMSGSEAYNAGAESSSFTAVANNYYQVTGTATCTLPTAVGVAGAIIGVQVQSGGTVTFNTTSSQTIVSASGHASGTIVDSNVGDQWWFISDGSNWDLQSMTVGF